MACLLSPSLASAADGPVLPLAGDDRAQIEKLLGKDVVVSALPARPLLAATAYMPKTSGKLIYLATEKGKKPQDETQTIKKISQPGSADSFEYDRAGKERMVFTSTENGGLAVSKDYDLEKEVISTFQPPQPLIVPGLAPGQSQQVSMAVAVADIDNPSKVEYNGSLNVTCTNLGRFKVKVPAGTYDADLIKWTFSGDIGPASVETSQYRFIAEGAGMVAMVQWRSISAMLIYHEKSRVGKVLRKAE
jgi:hypothetical protein